MLEKDINNINQSIRREIERSGKEYDRKRFESELVKLLNDVIFDLRNLFNSIDRTVIINFRQGQSSHYVKAIEFTNSTSDRVLFFNKDSIDYCNSWYKSVVTRRGKRGGPVWGKRNVFNRIRKIENYQLNKEDLLATIRNLIFDDFDNYKEQMQINAARRSKMIDIFGNLVDSKIVLLNSNTQGNWDQIKFKLLKNFSVTDSYMENEFIREMKFLKRKNVREYVFMIPKYNHLYNRLGFEKYVPVDYFERKIIEHFNSFGFGNVEFLKKSEVIN